MRIAVRVRAAASRTRVGGRWGDRDVLVVAVAARPVDGAATAAVVAAVADAFAVRPRAVTLVSGERSRSKVLDVAVDEQHGQETLTRLLASG